MKLKMKHILPGLLCTGMIFQANALTLKQLSEHRTGVFDASAAEIPAYSKTTKKLFVVNAGGKTVDVMSMNDPTNLSLDTALSLADYGYSAANSVATYDNILAVAAEAVIKQDSGAVLLLDLNNNYALIKAFKTGPLPDMVAISKDGQFVMSANEGEPNGAYDNDPEGSMTLIQMSDTTSTQINFKSYNDSLAVLRAKGVRIS